MFATPRKRSNHPVHKTKQLGIAGLCSVENEVYIFDESDNEASTSGAAPASLIESDEDETPRGKLSKTSLCLRKPSVLPLKLPPRRATITSLRCLVSLTTKANFTVPKPSPIIPTVGSPLTRVARPVSRKELLQSSPARASMKAEWDRLRSKMV